MISVLRRAFTGLVNFSKGQQCIPQNSACIHLCVKVSLGGRAGKIGEWADKFCLHLNMNEKDILMA